MDWSFTEEQEQLAALARQILERELSEERLRAAEAAPDRYDHALYATLDDAGVTNAYSYGLIELCRVLIEIGRAVAPVPLVYTAVAQMVHPFDGLVSPAIVEELNPDATNPVTRAEPGERGWMLTGAKTTVPAGMYANAFLVPATTSDGPRLFLVERQAPGVHVERQLVTSVDTEALLTLQDAVGTEVGDVDAIERLLDLQTVALCAVQVGVCERAVELTAEYAKQRVQFDRPIATFQAVGQRLADAYIDVNAMRLVLWQAVWRLSEGLEAGQEIATAKFWAADGGNRVAHTAVHIHGGVGIDLDYHLNRYFVAAKRIEFALGTASEQLALIGRALASEPA